MSQLNVSDFTLQLLDILPGHKVDKIILPLNSGFGVHGNCSKLLLQFTKSFKIDLRST